MIGVMRPQLLVDAWSALGGARSTLDRVRVRGHTGLSSQLPVNDLATGAVAAQLLAAAELTGSRADLLHIDARHVGFAFRSERHLRVGGRGGGMGFAPLSDFHPTADGWVRLHANYQHHRDAVLRALGRDPVEQMLSRRSTEVEEAVVAEGGVAAAVRAREAWRQHPAGAAADDLPLLTLQRVADGPTRARSMKGLRVLDLTRVIAGPVATRTLASHGADVLRIDHPGLPEDQATHLETGPGKRHVALDLSARRDREAFDGLLKDADVLVQGYRPGALASFGLSAPELAERFPALVVASVSAWGAAGPWAHRRGFDSIVQAATGVAARTAGADGSPGVLPAQALDHGTGHLLAAAVMRAVTGSQRRGGTWHAELSLVQLATWLLRAPQEPPAPAPQADEPGVEAYLMQLSAPSNRTMTVVRPPGSPPWAAGPVRLSRAELGWRGA